MIWPQACALVILASGASKRFGPEDKLLAPLGDYAVCEHIIKTVQQIDFAKIYAVIPSDTPKREAVFVRENINIIYNTTPQNGHEHSLQLAAQTIVNSGIKHMCIVLADMPYVTTVHLYGLLERANSEVIISNHNGIDMPPVIFSGNAVHSLSTAPHLRKTMLKTPTTLRLELSDKEAKDIDVPDDLF
ncbi:MAG: hypothetical protein COA43_12725 [Robiginitomaculum sp.]|nr:MAG: hypothetical protein COA43_12725 [Robiginitomaculum sp.]